MTPHPDEFGGQDAPHAPSAWQLRYVLAVETIEAIERANHGQYGEVSDSRIADIIADWRRSFTS